MGTPKTDRIPLTASLFDRLARLGLDLDALAPLAGLRPARFAEPAPELTTAEYFALFRAIEGCAGGDVGLRLAATHSQEDNVAALAALRSPTFGEGLGKLARYKRLACPEALSVKVDRGEVRIRLEWLLAVSDPPHSLVDAVFAGILELARRGTGTALRPERVELARARAHEAALVRCFDCDVLFDAPADVLVLAPSALKLPLVTRDADLLSTLQPELDHALAATGAEPTLADAVRAALGRRISGERPSVGKVARDLGLSARTLQRRLREDGTTYQVLLDEVRRRTALRLLARTSLRVEEVAFLLGFDELNSFTRAFRAWERTTPNGWRALRSIEPARVAPRLRPGSTRARRLEERP